jgi:hypothetical protein
MFNPFDQIEVLEDLSEHPFSPESVACELGLLSPGERRWMKWVSDAEALLGIDSLDGDQEGDGYSLDYAQDAYSDGLTPEQYADEVRRRSPDQPLTAKENDVTKLERLRDNARWDVEHLTKRLAAWRERFEKDPADALEWSSQTFDEAGRLRVAQQVVTMCEAGTSTENLRRVALEEAMREARWPSRSTSVPSNEMARSLASAWADLYSKLEDSR